MLWSFRRGRQGGYVPVVGRGSRDGFPVSPVASAARNYVTVAPDRVLQLNPGPDGYDMPEGH